MFQKFSRIALAGVLLPAFLFLSNGPDAQAQSNHRCANYPTNYVTDGRATVAGEGGLCAIGGGEPVERSSGNTIRCATGNKPTRPTGLTATAFHDSSESGIRLAWNAPGSATEADRNVWAYEIYRRNEVTETKMTLYHVLKRRLNTRVGTLPAGENWRVFPDSCFGPTATNPGIGANNPNGTCDTVPLGSDYRKRTPGLTYARYSHLNGPGCTRGTTGAVFVNQMLSWGSGNTTFVDPFVTPGQSYAYRVVAQTIHSELDTTNLHDHPGRNYAGKRRSDWSVAASATLTARAPGAPTGVGGTLDSSGFIKVSWTAPTATTTTSGPQGYQLRRSSDSGSTWTELPTLRGLSRALCNYGGTTVSCASATGTLPTSHIDKSASVTANTAYIYQVRAKRFHCINHGQIGNGCTDSEWTGSWSTSTASVTTGGTLTRDSALKPDKVIVDDSGNRPQPIPVPAQELPAGSATISADKTQLNLQEVVTLSAATANAPDGIAPKYHWQYHGNGRWLDLYAGQTWAPSFTYLEIKPQIMVFRVRVAYGTEYVADSAPVAVTWGNPDATVTIDGDTVTFNSPATGLPTISGTARVGETLTASTSGIADPDGLAGATFAYQWISSRDGTDTDIAGATASTYTLAAADAGAAIKVRVGFNDDNGNAATLTSAATAAVAAADGEAPPSVGKSVQRDTQQTAATTAAPGRVPGLRASLTSSGHVSLTWTAPGVEDDGSNAPAIYRIVRRAAGGAFGLLTSVPGVSTTHTDSTVAAGTSYVYRVQGVNGAGSGQLSPPAAIGAPHPLTAAFHGLPNGHNGKNLFTFEVRFSEDVSGLTAGPVKRALTVANGRIVDVTRAVSGKNRRWTVKVRPSSFDDIAIALAATADCSATGAICDSNGRKLTDAVSATVSGPVAVSVADARANEGPDAAVAFTVTLSRAAADTVTVDYATRDGTATAGADYTFTRGTLTFAVGETEKTVSVPLLDDAHDEGEETFTLKLTGAAGAVIADGEATGTIVNSDPLQQVWLARFGRTVAIQTVEALEGRFAVRAGAAPRMTVTVMGQTLNLSQTGEGQILTAALTGLARTFGATPPNTAANDNPFARHDVGGAWGGARTGTWGGARTGTGAPAPARRPTMRELLPGSAFHFTTGEVSGLGGAMTSWGKVLSDTSSGAGNGGLSFAGETATGVLGVDWEGDWLLAGVALSRSVETGGAAFAPSGTDYGIAGSLTMVTPYLRVRAGEGLSFWSALGSGAGAMTLSWDGVSQSADIAMRLAAAGGRAELLRPGPGGGLALALKADAFFVRTRSARVSTPGAGNLAAATGDASRVRAVLEGSRAFALPDGGALEPSLSLGLRQDGGDDQSGAGVEIGGRVTWRDPETGLSVEARARTLIARKDSNYREWGAHASVRLAPGDRGRGLSFSLSPAWGAASPGGVERLWSAREAGSLAPGLAPGVGATGGSAGKFRARQRLDGGLGYGVALFGDRFTGTPNLGFGISDTARDYRIGWRLTSAVRNDPGFELNLDATRQEAVGGNTPAQHGIMLQGSVRW